MERRTLKSTLEVSTNIAVLLVAVAALSTLAITVFLKPSAPNFLLGLEKGKAFGQVSNIDYGGSERTLLIALNTNCSYCRESLPLYRKLLAAQHQGSKSLRIIALFPNTAEDVARYIKENQFVVDTVTDVDFGSLPVSGTPTMILLNNRGKIEDFWIGKLAAPEADELVHSITATQ